MNRRNKIIIAVCVLALLILPNITQAAPSWFPIVPCGLNQQPAGIDKSEHDYTQPCNQCLLIGLGKNLLDFTFFGIIPMVGTLFFLWAGFLILWGGRNGDPGAVKKGTHLITQTAIGIAIMLSSWLIANFILKTLATEDRATEWYKIECRVSDLRDLTDATVPRVGTDPQPAPAPGVPAPGVPATCSAPQQLAASNNEPYPKQNAPELDQLLSCIRSKLPGQNLGSVYTFDQSYELCNYTRGQRTCSSKCSHAINSCHYGGRVGAQGALAVDFGNQAIGDQIIQAALSCGAKSARCENAAGRDVGCSPGSGANHVHVNSRSCDAN